MKKIRLVLSLIVALTSLFASKINGQSDVVKITGKFETPACPIWVNSAVFYHIYPQTFYDTDGTGLAIYKVLLKN